MRLRLVRPLEWPIEAGPIRPQRSGQFRADGRPITVTAALSRLEDELDRHKARNAELSADFGTTRGGNVAREQKGSPACVLLFDIDPKAYTLPVATYYDLASNVAALAAHLDALRSIERYGVATVAQMMGAFTALPCPATWREILGNPKTLGEAEATYRRLIMSAHPDRGGSSQEAARLNEAIAKARGELS